MAAAICRVVGRRLGSPPSVGKFPWWLITLLSPFVATFKELREMKYLWNAPVRMRNAKLLAVLKAEPHTPLELAVQSTLEGLGCLAG